MGPRIVNPADKGIDLTQAVYHSPGITTIYLDQVAIQINVYSVTGNNGVFTVEGSNDNVNWTQLCFPNTQTVLPSATLANAAITILFQVQCTPAYVRISYARGATHTDGKADIWYSGKEI